MMDLSTMSDAAVFALRNDVIAEANKRQAVAEVCERIQAAISSVGEAAADAAYADAKAVVFDD
jgi:hypothetical protein